MDLRSGVSGFYHTLRKIVCGTPDAAKSASVARCPSAKLRGE